MVISITGQGLTIGKLVQVARYNEKNQLDPKSVKK